MQTGAMSPTVNIVEGGATSRGRSGLVGPLGTPCITLVFAQFALDLSVFLKKPMDIVSAAHCRPLGFISDNAGNICNAVEMQPNTLQLNCLAHSAELLVKDLNAMWPGMYACPSLRMGFGAEREAERWP